jgi:hypothetical protein
MFYADRTKKCLPRIFVCLSVTAHFYLGNMLLHVVTDINYVDRGFYADRTKKCLPRIFVCLSVTSHFYLVNMF